MLGRHGETVGRVKDRTAVHAAQRQLAVGAIDELLALPAVHDASNRLGFSER